MKFDKLKNKIFEKRKTYKECANVLGISIVAFSNKINGRYEFKVTEVIKLAEFLSLTPEESQSIFLINNLNKIQTNQINSLISNRLLQEGRKEKSNEENNINCRCDIYY